MFATLKRDWKFLNGETGEETIILAGRHELERIPNPLGHDCWWLVLKGTKVGGAEGSWRQWRKGQIVENPCRLNNSQPIDWEDFEIVIEE